MRWDQPERGTIPPFDFIPMAEESGLVVAIGAWVLEEACRQAVTWSCTFGSTPRMAVNGSGRQLGEPSFVGHVADVLASTGMTLRSL